MVLERLEKASDVVVVKATKVDRCDCRCLRWGSYPIVWVVLNLTVVD